MSRTVQITLEELSQAEQLRKSATSIKDYRRSIVVIILAKTDLSAEQVADIVGINRKTVFEDLSKIRNHDDSPPPQHGGRHSSLLTVEEEIQFLESWLEKSKLGQIVSIPQMHSAFNDLVGHIVPRSTLSRILKRHNWRKIKPDTKHPKADPVAQEEFKKNSRIWFWQPPKKRTTENSQL